MLSWIQAHVVLVKLLPWIQAHIVLVKQQCVTLNTSTCRFDKTQCVTLDASTCRLLKHNIYIYVTLDTSTCRFGKTQYSYCQKTNNGSSCFVFFRFAGR